MKPSRYVLGPLLACVALAACDSGRQSLPQAIVNVIHAAPSYLTIRFRREARGEEIPLNFAGAAQRSWDADEYDFDLLLEPPTASGPQLETTFTATLSEQNEHYFVLTEVGGALTPIVVEEPTFDTESADGQVTIYHAGPALGAVDVFLEAPAADITAETPLGGIGFREQIDPTSFTPGQYRLTLTEPGTPGNVVYRSAAFDISAGQDNFLVIIDEAGQSIAAAGVTRVTPSASARLGDVSAQVALRVVNGARDRADRDVVLDGNFTTPLFAAVPFATEVAYATIASGTRSLTITPAGNSGVLELESELTAQPGGSYTYVFGGPAGTLDSVTALEDRRRIADTARLRVMHAAAQFDTLDMLVVAPGTPLADATMGVQLDAFATSQSLSLPPGDYDIGLRASDSGTILAGPVTVTLADRGIYAVAALDGTTATSAEMLLLDDFQ